MKLGAAGTNWWNSGTSDFNGSDPDYSAFVVTNSTTPSPNTWTAATPGALAAKLQTGNQYRIISRSADLAGNTEFGPLNGVVPAGVGHIVLYVSAAPVAVSTMPLANQPYYHDVSAHAGTADDTTSGSGVAGVDIALLDVLNHYWTGSGWTTSPCGSQLRLSCRGSPPISWGSIASGTWTYTTLPEPSPRMRPSPRAIVR